MAKYNYLFCDPHNGYYNSYKPFTSDRKITQEQAENFILMRNAHAKRIGCSFLDLAVVASDHGYHIWPYRCEYRKDSERNLWSAMSGEPDLDDLPASFNDWPIINGISGNY